MLGLSLNNQRVSYCIKSNRLSLFNLIYQLVSGTKHQCADGCRSHSNQAADRYICLINCRKYLYSHPIYRISQDTHNLEYRTILTTDTFQSISSKSQLFHQGKSRMFRCNSLESPYFQSSHHGWVLPTLDQYQQYASPVVHVGFIFHNVKW